MRNFGIGHKRLKEQGINDPEPVNPKIALPILAAAADETNEELQDLWERPLAAAMNPNRAKQVRLGFAEALQRLDPLDAIVMKWFHQHSGGMQMGDRNDAAKELKATRDEVDVSLSNLAKCGFVDERTSGQTVLMPFGREFFRTVQD